MPVYRAVVTKTGLVRKILQELQPLITMLPETLPQEIIKAEGLMSYSEAVQNIHYLSTDHMNRAKNGV